MNIGQRVRVRDEFRLEGDFEEAVISNIESDGTIDVTVDGQDWGQWFCRLLDGSYEIEPVDERTSTAANERGAEGTI